MKKFFLSLTLLILLTISILILYLSFYGYQTDRFNKIIKTEIEKNLKRYHISLNQILNADYVYKFSNSQNIPLIEMASKIIDGYNKNEVKIVSKTQKNKGFFEKFFDLFN